MFEVKFLNALLLELEDSLIQEFDKISSHLQEEEKQVFQVYRKHKSYAGMDSWLNNFRELEYLNLVLRELTYAFQKNNLLNFYNEISFSLQEDFGTEDFRFIDWERTEPKYEKLLEILLKWILDRKKALQTIEENYIITQNSLNYYYKASGDPSQLGVDVSLVKKKTPTKKILQFQQAERELKLLFPYGYELYKTLTYKVIFVQSRGLVSYSHFYELGISYLNTIDRNLIETIDDLVHETSHHHLNLLLKKYKIFLKEDKELKFYSPWRDSLRSLYAILHACFTFSFGRKLFFSIITSPYLNKTTLTKKDIDFARFRFLEETLMLDYSLKDLELNLFQFTKKGKEICNTLFNWQKEAIFIYQKIFKELKNQSYKKKIFDLKNKLEKYKLKYLSKTYGH